MNETEQTEQESDLTHTLRSAGVYRSWCYKEIDPENKPDPNYKPHIDAALEKGESILNVTMDIGYVHYAVRRAIIQGKAAKVYDTDEMVFDLKDKDRGYAYVRAKVLDLDVIGIPMFYDDWSKDSPWDTDHMASMSRILLAAVSAGVILVLGSTNEFKECGWWPKWFRLKMEREIKWLNMDWNTLGTDAARYVKERKETMHDLTKRGLMAQHAAKKKRGGKK